jgi:hypothetical protein
MNLNDPSSINESAWGGSAWSTTGIVRVWKIQNLGNFDDDFEISVIRYDNKQGTNSYGWPSSTKLILFGSGEGENSLDDLEFKERRETFALYVAKGVCNYLNNGGNI